MTNGRNDLKNSYVIKVQNKDKYFKINSSSLVSLEKATIFNAYNKVEGNKPPQEKINEFLIKELPMSRLTKENSFEVIKAASLAVIGYRISKDKMFTIENAAYWIGSLPKGVFPTYLQAVSERQRLISNKIAELNKMRDWSAHYSKCWNKASVAPRSFGNVDIVKNEDGQTFWFTSEFAFTEWVSLLIHENRDINRMDIIQDETAEEYATRYIESYTSFEYIGFGMLVGRNKVDDVFVFNKIKGVYKGSE